MDRIDSFEAAKDCPYAMINDYGDIFYPDNKEDGDFFATACGAWYINPDWNWADEV